MEEQRLRIQQAKIDEARLQIMQTQRAKAALEKELEVEEAGRKEASEGQTKQWRDAALKTHLCLASVRAKEQEAAQLRAALSKPDSISEAFATLVKKLQTELEQANSEASDAQREVERVTQDIASMEGRTLAPA